MRFAALISMLVSGVAACSPVSGVAVTRAERGPHMAEQPWTEFHYGGAGFGNSYYLFSMSSVSVGEADGFIGVWITYLFQGSGIGSTQLARWQIDCRGRRSRVLERIGILRESVHAVSVVDSEFRPIAPDSPEDALARILCSRVRETARE